MPRTPVNPENHENELLETWQKMVADKGEILATHLIARILADLLRERREATEDARRTLENRERMVRTLQSMVRDLRRCLVEACSIVHSRWPQEPSLDRWRRFAKDGMNPGQAGAMVSLERAEELEACVVAAAVGPVEPPTPSERLGRIEVHRPDEPAVYVEFSALNDRIRDLEAVLASAQKVCERNVKELGSRSKVYAPYGYAWQAVADMLRAGLEAKDG